MLQTGVSHRCACVKLSTKGGCRTIFRAARKGTNLKGQTPICNFPRVSCENLRFSAKISFSQVLCFPGIIEGENQRKSARIRENLRLGSVCPLRFVQARPDFWRSGNFTEKVSRNPERQKLTNSLSNPCSQNASLIPRACPGKRSILGQNHLINMGPLSLASQRTQPWPYRGKGSMKMILLSRTTGPRHG